MVEPLTVGVVTAALVAKLYEKSLEKASDVVVDTSASALGKLVAFVKKRLGRASDDAKAVAELEAAPDSPSRQAALAVVIDRVADEDPEFRSELSELVRQAQTQGGVNLANQTATDSPDTVQVANSLGANISINRPPVDRL